MRHLTSGSGMEVHYKASDISYLPNAEEERKLPIPLCFVVSTLLSIPLLHNLPVYLNTTTDYTETYKIIFYGCKQAYCNFNFHIMRKVRNFANYKAGTWNCKM